MGRRLDAVTGRGYAGIPLKGTNISLNQGGTANNVFVSPLTKCRYLVKGVFIFSGGMYDETAESGYFGRRACGQPLCLCPGGVRGV